MGNEEANGTLAASTTKQEAGQDESTGGRQDSDGLVGSKTPVDTAEAEESKTAHIEDEILDESHSLHESELSGAVPSVMAGKKAHVQVVEAEDRAHIGVRLEGGGAGTTEGVRPSTEESVSSKQQNNRPQALSDSEAASTTRPSDGSEAPARERAATLSETLLAAQSIIRDQEVSTSNTLEPAANSRIAQHRSSQASSIASDSNADSPTREPTTIHGVVLVGFNHSLGPVVDYSYPHNLKDDEDIARSLPFLALPDGAHMHDEDYSCFHLYLPNISHSTVYGISCIRQLRADELLRKSSDITRSTVQKGVVVLANKPIFGPIRDKLGVITRAFFAQKDFDETEILEHFYHSLVHALKDDEQTDESAISMGVSVREIVWKFRMQTLTLFKLLLLQKRVMFYSNQVERLCSFQYALVSLVPLLLLNLEDAASPLLDSRSRQMRKASSLRSSDRKSLLAYLGLPLDLFGKGAFFQPYLPLQQLDMLKSDSYLVGATNSIFMSQRDCPIDVVVNLETANIEFLNPKVASMVGLTAADRKWMDEIVRTVESTWNPADPHRPVGMGFKASDDWLRSRFEEYLTSALSAIKFVDFLIRNKDMAILINPNDPSGLGSFNESWLASFRSTPAFDLWNKHTDPVIFDLVEPKHPCEGQAHVIEDVGIRLVNGLHDLHLDERLGPTQEAISKGIATGSEGMWKFYSSVKTDLAKRQAEYRERREKEEAIKATVQGDPASRHSVDAERPQLISDQVLAGAAEVGGRAATLATNIGSFFGSRLGKQRSNTQLAGAAEEAKAAQPTPNATQPSESDTNRPRLGLFSSFRNTSASAPSGSLPENTSTNRQTETSSSLASPPLASTFGSFFRRSSSTSDYRNAEPAKSSLNETDSTAYVNVQKPGRTSSPDDFENASTVWADAKAQPSQPSHGSSTQLRDEQSSFYERSSLDSMSDVKL